MASIDEFAHADSPPSRREFRATGTIVVFVLAFLYRFLTAAFANDHFMHLAEAQQVLSGEWPVRDFFDFGLPLQVLTSAFALRLFGYNLLGEAIVTTGFIAAGAALTYHLSLRLSGSRTIASGAALITAFSEPRLYNYPKAFFYVAALLLASRYAARQSAARLMALGALAGVAFLYRHDHGAYIAVCIAVFCAVLFWGTPRRIAGRLAICGAAAIAVVLPFLVFVETTVGLRAYLRDMRFGAAVSMTPRFNLLPFTFDRKSRLILFAPANEPRITVRWAPTVDVETQSMLEERYRLTDGRREAPLTWSYVPGARDGDSIRALVNDPEVLDTSGIDRSTSAVDFGESWYQWLERKLPLLRMDLAPSLTSSGNALAWFYYATFVIAAAGFLSWMWAASRGRLTREQSPVVAMSAVMSLIVVQTLVRGSPDSRLPDATGTVAVTGAWLAAFIAGSRPGLNVRRAAAWTVFLVTLWSVMTYSSSYQTVARSRLLDGPGPIRRKALEVVRRLSRRPINDWGHGSVTVRALARYANECTDADDRLVVAWFEPMINFYSERRFAGGMPFFDNGWFDSGRDQERAIQRLQRQSVPLVFIREDAEHVFRAAFPRVAAYVDDHFSRALARVHPEWLVGYQVLVARDRTPVDEYEPLGLPCHLARPYGSKIPGPTE